ncbi:MAG: hypothetical protein JRI68_01790, partial [Deltaproteobacteria bacterium]|nr:hypothetical protein [Deltaproteobacteria bacterium]
PIEDSPEPVAITLRALVPPGQGAAVRVDAAKGPTDVVDPSVVLSEAAEEAVAAAPSWLRSRLRIRLGMVDLALQDELAAQITNAPDDRLVDEIAFAIANTQEHDLALELFDAAVFTENAEAIYEYAAAIPYAQVVDIGAPGSEDQVSTVHYDYLDADGVPATYGLDPETYYWWVVHPKLDHEELVPVDPTTGEAGAAPLGVHWRRYLMESSDQTFDYRDHYLLREPHDLRDQELGMAASSHLTAPDIYPLRLFVDDHENGLLVEVDLGGGTLLATTLDLAQAYADGGAPLLTNLATYGNTNITLKSNADVAVVMDSEPWGENVYSAALAEAFAIPTIIDSTTFATLTLAAFDKIIVAADQDAALYMAVAARTPELETFVADGGVLQLDLHTLSPIAGLVFPGAVEVAGGPPAAVLEEGQPRLWDYITATPIVWDSIPYPGMSGGRPPLADGMAMDIIGWFVTQNMYDNVSEYVGVTGIPSPERSWYPQRIIHNHYGNCGELGDLMAAAGRASLLPVRVLSSVEDHCWNDVFIEDRWVPWQVDWSDGPTRIDNPGVGSDQEYVGGKTLSGLYTLRGDGYPEDGAIANHSDTVTFVISVEDLAGRPIDGAMVLFATESFYDPESLSVAAVEYTDSDGVAEIMLGNDRNYSFHVRSTAGGFVEYPVADLDPQTIKVEPIAEVADTGAGAVIARDVVLDVTHTVTEAQNVASPTDGELAVATINAEVVDAWVVAEGFFTEGHFIKQVPTAKARYYLLDQEAYEALWAWTPFDALAAAEDAPGLQGSSVGAPAGEPLWLVAYNPNVTETLEVDLELQVLEP